MNLDHDVFQVNKLREDQKKRSSPKVEHCFSQNSGEDQKKRSLPKNGIKRSLPKVSPNSNGDLRSDAHQSEIIEGDADEDHTQIIGGYIPHPLRVSAPLVHTVKYFDQDSFVGRIVGNKFKLD